MTEAKEVEEFEDDMMPIWEECEVATENTAEYFDDTRGSLL